VADRVEPESVYDSEVAPPTVEAVESYDKSTFCEIELMDQSLWDDAEQWHCRKDTVISEDGDSFHQILKRFDPVISYDHLEIYRRWLLTNSPDASGLSLETLPVGRGEYLSGGIHFPRPTGHPWRYMLERWELDQGGGDPTPLIRRSMHTTPRGNL